MIFTILFNRIRGDLFFSFLDFCKDSVKRAKDKRSNKKVNRVIMHAAVNWLHNHAI